MRVLVAVIVACFANTLIAMEGGFSVKLGLKSASYKEEISASGHGSFEDTGNRRTPEIHGGCRIPNAFLWRY
jgi:hypothetical protein